MGRDEQVEEREVLAAIFPDEIVGEWIIHISRSYGGANAWFSADIDETHFRVSIALDVDDDNVATGDDDEEDAKRMFSSFIFVFLFICALNRILVCISIPHQDLASNSMFKSSI